jgi:carbamoyltransferase
MTYTILAINPGHNGSAALVVDGELVYYTEEERLSRSKYDGNPFKAINYILNNHVVDELIIGGTNPQLPQLPWTNEDPYTALVRKSCPNVKVTNLGNLHHLGHASAAFYNSGFDTAVAIVVDGAGSVHQEQIGTDGPVVAGFETESIYYCSYPHEFNAVYKRYSDGQSNYYDNGIQEFTNTVTITKAYEAVSDYLGFGFIEAGKTMGLSPYGTEDSDIPDFFVNGRGNRNLLIPRYPAGAHIDENNNPYLKRFNDPKEWHNDFSLCRDIDKNIAYKIQKESEEQMMLLIEKALDITGERNVVISGGFALNCVANYKYLKRFPDINFYIDPIAHDGGTAIGLAKYAWYNYSQETQLRPLNNVYLGMNPNYDILQMLVDQVPNIQVTDVSYDNVAELIENGNIIALLQGSAEGGPRALGNRSILFDPRRTDGKDFVNGVKRREWFRPFAGSVMVEHAREWFDMATLNESPYMMYAVDVWPDKVDQIPAVTHVDNTCRVQTVTAEQNPHYYRLIESFHNRTGVPLVMNTSFNLAGQPLVESLYDAFLTLVNSDINYLYLPDLGKLISK